MNYDYKKMKKAELLELVEELIEEVEQKDSEIEGLEEYNTEFENSLYESQSKVEELEEELQENNIERFIAKIEELDPSFNRGLDLSNNYLPKIYA